MVVDDQPSFRRAAASVIELVDGFVVGALVDSGEEALRVLDERPVDLVLLDINMPGLRGPAVARAIRERHPDVVVVLVSTYDPDGLPDDVANGMLYLHKEMLGPDELADLWEHRRRP
jgi:DNA-binding NarL/FixJ family response regulator